MVEIISLEEITALIKDIDLVAAMEEGFIEYSNGNTVVPPVGELLFDNPKGDAHIKYGYIKGDDFFTIKIAAGFYDNPKLGLSSSQGMMLLFSQKTGEPKAVLLDNGKLTDLRTAAAGALAAKYFAPKSVKAIGILGTGIQAKLQLEFLLQIIACDIVWVWGIDPEEAKAFKEKYMPDLVVHIAQDPAEVARNANLIVTATPAENPLLQVNDILPGTHITAMGSDTAVKQELSGNILNKADLVISDSIPQSKSRGEVYRAVQEGAISEDKAIELGVTLQKLDLQRTNDKQITVVDLTGVAVQDIMITKAVYTKYLNNK